VCRPRKKYINRWCIICGREQSIVFRQVWHFWKKMARSSADTLFLVALGSLLVWTSCSTAVTDGLSLEHRLQQLTNGYVSACLKEDHFLIHHQIYFLENPFTLNLHVNFFPTHFLLSVDWAATKSGWKRQSIGGSQTPAGTKSNFPVLLAIQNVIWVRPVVCLSPQNEMMQLSAERESQFKDLKQQHVRKKK
jgi:hypothetical protein